MSSYNHHIYSEWCFILGWRSFEVCDCLRCGAHECHRNIPYWCPLCLKFIWTSFTSSWFYFQITIWWFQNCVLVFPDFDSIRLVGTVCEVKWITVCACSRRFSPLCVSCNEPIIPAPGSEETVRVVALDKNFHLKCYRCEVRHQFAWKHP